MNYTSKVCFHLVCWLFIYLFCSSFCGLVCCLVCTQLCLSFLFETWCQLPFFFVLSFAMLFLSLFFTWMGWFMFRCLLDFFLRFCIYYLVFVDTVFWSLPFQPLMGLLFVELLMCVVFEKDSSSVYALLIIVTMSISV